MPSKSKEEKILAKGGDRYMTTTILILINGYFLVRACYVLDTVLSTKNFTYNISRGSSQQLCVVGIATLILLIRKLRLWEVICPRACS